MATQTITFSDKSTGGSLLASDVNSIKSVVNNNSSELSTLQTTVANIDTSGISTNATAIGTLETNVSTIDTDLTDVYNTVQSNSATSWTGGGSSYSDTDVATYLNGNLSTHIIPNTNAQYDIGSAEKKIRHLFLSDNSLKFVDNSNAEFSLGVNGCLLYTSDAADE